jgi:hypothetical protein
MLLRTSSLLHQLAVVELGYFNQKIGRKVPAERQAESREAKRGGKQGTSTKVVDNDFQQKRTCLKTHFGYPSWSCHPN